MTKLFQNPDGADAQSRSVLAFLSEHDGIEKSWNINRITYDASPTVARWHNGREQGYIVSMRNRSLSEQINIAFFTHRNSDDICAVEWKQLTINPPNIDTMETFGTIYKNKNDVSIRFPSGNCEEMADWIYARLSEFWVSFS